MFQRRLSMPPEENSYAGRICAPTLFSIVVINKKIGVVTYFNIDATISLLSHQFFPFISGVRVMSILTLLLLLDW